MAFGTHSVVRLPILVMAAHLASATMPCAAAEEVGSPFPAMAEAVGDPVRPGESSAVRLERLLAGVEQAPAGDPQQDTNRLEIAGKVRPGSQEAERVVARCDAAALERLVRAGTAKREFGAVRLFADAYVARDGSEPAAVEMANAGGTAHMVLDPTPGTAVQLWAWAARAGRDTPDGLAAQVHLEAVTGARSIAGFEAANALAKLQASHGTSDYRAQLAARRVIEASQRPFFAEYLSSPAIGTVDKAKLLYQVVYQADAVGEAALVRSAAGQIFGLVGYDNGYSERSALAVAHSYELESNHAQAAMQYEAFVQGYPNSEKAADASLACGRNLELAGRMEDALVQYEVTARLYPNSPAGRRATHARDNLVSTNAEAGQLALSAQRVDSAVAALRRTPDFAAVWPATPTGAPAARSLPPPDTDIGGVAAPPGSTVPQENPRLSAVAATRSKGGN